MNVTAADQINFANEFRDPSKPIIQPKLFAQALHLELQDLAELAGVSQITVNQAPDNAQLQSFMRESLRAMSAAYEITGDRDRAIHWYRNSPIPEFGHQTAEKIVAAGKTDAVLKYLISTSAGSSG